MAEKLVVFDLDGTLLDTLEDIRGAINYALSAWSLPKVEKEKIRLCVGHGLRNALFTAISNSSVNVPEEDLPLMVELMMLQTSGKSSPIRKTSLKSSQNKESCL